MATANQRYIKAVLDLLGEIELPPHIECICVEKSRPLPLPQRVFNIDPATVCRNKERLLRWRELQYVGLAIGVQSWNLYVRDMSEPVSTALDRWFPASRWD